MKKGGFDEFDETGQRADKDTHFDITPLPPEEDTVPFDDLYILHVYYDEDDDKRKPRCIKKETGIFDQNFELVPDDEATVYAHDEEDFKLMKVAARLAARKQAPCIVRAYSLYKKKFMEDILYFQTKIVFRKMVSPEVGLLIKPIKEETK